MAQDGMTMKILDGDFSKAIRALKRANQKIMPGQMGRAILFEWLRKIILKWPVDTGRSRAGWSAGAKFSGLKIPQGRDAAAFLEGAAKSGLTITGSAGHIVIEVTNAVDYAVDIERGTASRQAPLGAVEISLLEIQQQRVPDEVMEAYSFLWQYLGKAPGSVEIRASDVQAAIGRTGRGAAA